ncbi:MAG TPA: ATP-binding protein [Kofleriaceae bacterium]|nr:ATP-binding protein [Kofleriaceae bacterium]
MAPVPSESGSTRSEARASGGGGRRGAERNLQVLGGAIRALARHSDLPSVLRTAAEQVRGAFDSVTSILLVDGDRLRPGIVLHPDPAIAAEIRTALNSVPLRVGQGISGRAVATGKPQLVRRITAETLATRTPPRLRELVRRLPDSSADKGSSVAAVPLVRDGRAIGVVTASRAATPEPLSDGDLALLEGLADQIALAIDHARLRERSVRLARLSEGLAHTTGTREVAGVVARIAREVLGADAAAGWLIRPGTGELELVAETGERGAARKECLPADADTPMSRAMERGEVLLISSREELERDFPEVLRYKLGAGFEAWAILPFVIDGRGAGGVCLSFREPRVFVGEDRRALAMIASQAAVAIERSRLFEAERQARSRAERADRRKDEFLAMLGHELRNPLSPILTALELMRLRADDQVRKERQIIERQVSHLVRLVDDLLDVSRITRGKVELRRRPIEVAEIVAKAIEMASPLLEERRHQLATSMPTSGVVVYGDEQRLAQVVANLLTNAARYTEPGGSIAVRATTDGRDVEIEVSDTGAGIAPDLLPVLFDMFVQGERALDRSEGGLGLGLAIVSNLVAQHGGTVRADSPGLGRGSTFTVRLPLAGEDAALAAEVAPPSRRATTERGEIRRVLVVDDNRDAAETLAEALSYFGYETRVALDGPGALAAAPGFEPHAALLDIGLPLMDGYELADRLRALPGMDDLRLVAVTGYGQPSDRKRSLEAGFDEHMVKPVDPRALEALLARLIGGGARAEQVASQ